MTGNHCIVCGNTRSKDPGISFHRFHVAKRTLWSKLQLSSDQVMPHSRVCSRHFPARDATVMRPTYRPHHCTLSVNLPCSPHNCTHMC